MVLLEGFTALETCVFVGIIGIFALILIGIVAYAAWVIFGMTHAWLYAHTDRWLDRSRNSITDKVDSDEEE